MDSDEFDDGIADEDFLTAFEPDQSAIKEAVDDGLDNLPSDTFSSPEPAPRAPARMGSTGSGLGSRAGLNRTSSGNFRQTTLFGGEAAVADPRLSQSLAPRVFRADAREEPSHHELNREAMETWVYPTNLGAIRDYQFSIVKNSLFNNTLVALPTGLGKTFIAATVMLNFYRWTKSAKIVFVAPTKPLVAQQVDACYSIAGISRSDTTLLTGNVPPALRVDEWEKRRVFFMTPQTLLNDLSHGYADPKSIVLLVVDEAHRAVGEYAYAKVAKLIRRFSNSIRVLALTATPGSKIETVQEVIDNLGISHCEIRTEESIDIRQYVHERNIEQIILDPSDEMERISELFTKALQPLVDKLGSQNIYYGRNPMALTAYGLLQAQKEWFATRGKSANQGVQFMMRAIFSVLTSIAHSIKLLNFHGIKPFYDNLVDLRSDQEDKGQKGSKYKRQLIQDPSFIEMMDIISKWLRLENFVGHPKMTALADCILNHFMDNGEGTRVIVFSEYRDSAEEIVRMLNKHRPMIKASIFVGQADSKRAEGMKQAQQIQTIDKFRNGDFNVLVATSIGEEGLDIGQVDLIVCYDSSASPIRMLQRMGRTGRKRAGNIVLLLMRGKEEDQFAKSKDSYEKMQKLICEGSRFNFRFDLSTRIVPRDIRPDVDKRHVDIPIENTQDQSLPEPKKRRAGPMKKKPPKKFHMPDGVETGFQKLSDFMKAPSKSVKKRNPELDDVVSKPELRAVLLGDDELRELNRSYRDLPFNETPVEETAMPSMVSHPKLQRELRPTYHVKHGKRTKTTVRLLQKMARNSDKLVRPCKDQDLSNFQDIPVKAFVNSDGDTEDENEPQLPRLEHKRPRKSLDENCERSSAPKRRKTLKKVQPEQPLWLSQGNEEGEENEAEEGGEEQEEEEEDEEDEDVEEFGLTARRRGRKKGGRGGRGGNGTNWKAGINSDEIGDDCERDSDLLDDDDSDDGSDLKDFIASDNAVLSSLQESAWTSPTTPRQRDPPAEAEKPYYVPTSFAATQETEEDIPDLEVLVGNPKTSSDGIQEFGVDISRRRTIRTKRRVVDSDSDEDG
jgi:ATP-dependent DNA helicase MPH1